MSMVMRVCLFGVALLLLFLIVVVAMCQGVVVMCVSMPVGAVFPLARLSAVMMCYMIVVVGMGLRPVCVGACTALALSPLSACPTLSSSHCWPSEGGRALIWLSSKWLVGAR